MRSTRVKLGVLAIVLRWVVDGNDDEQAIDGGENEEAARFRRLRLEIAAKLDCTNSQIPNAEWFCRFRPNFLASACPLPSKVWRVRFTAGQPRRSQDRVNRSNVSGLARIHCTSTEHRRTAGLRVLDAIGTIYHSDMRQAYLK